MMRSPSMVILALVGCTLAATTANAHPKLVKSDPASGIVTATSPKELRLSFNEELVPKFTGAEVKDQKGKRIEVGITAPDPLDKKQLVVALPKPLAEGVYKVNWHAVAADTHRAQGSYSFTVKR